MHANVQNYYSHFANNSEVYRKLKSLAIDIRNIYQFDRDETDSIKEIIEILKSILIMESIEEYFSNNKSDLYFFMGEFSKEVIEYTTRQNIIYGENGHELALDMLFHFIKLFFKFHKNKEYSNLFENIRNIFNSAMPYFAPSQYKKEKNLKKSLTYEQFNEEFCEKFKKEKITQDIFNEGDKVDVLIKNKNTYQDLEKKLWVRGTITEIEDGNYTIRYPVKESYKEVKYPVGGKNIRGLGTMTQDWDWRLSLKKFDVVDCYDRQKWFPATVCEVIDYENSYGTYKEYKIGFRLYPEKFLENKDYNYDTFLANTVFWDNNNNPNDKEGNSYYGDGENCDEKISFYSKRIQKFQNYSLIQKEALNNLSNQYNQFYNSTNGQSNIINMQTQDNSAEEKIKNLTEMLCYEKDGSDEDEKYFYEKDGKKNYILAKNNDEYNYYYAKLLKMMEEAGYYEEMITFLKDKPNMIELYNIFYILIKSDPFLHKDYFKENNDVFKSAFFDAVESLTSKDIKIVQKEYIDYSISFLSRVNYIISGEKNSKKNKEIKVELSIKLIKSSIFDKKIQGLKMLTEYIKINLEPEEKIYIIEIIKKNNLIKELFGSNYHTQIINKSNEILEFMLKNNELTEEEIKLIWSLTEQGDLEAKMTIIKLLSDFIIYLNEKFCNIILNSINIEKITSFGEKEIDLIKNLAIKANDKKFIAKCCEIFCDKIFEINNINILEKSPYVNIVENFFEKDEICCKRIIDICESNLKQNKNVLIVLFLLEKIIEKNKKKIKTEKINEINDEKDFIGNEIYNLIENNKLLYLFKDNLESYKKRAKEAIKNDNNLREKNLMIDGNNHENNMKYRIIFLIKIIPMLYPKFDFFTVMKEICLVDPIFESDKTFFYDFMEKFISEVNKDIVEDSSNEKIAIKEQLFNMLANENKNNISSSQFNLYIKLFLDINSHKNYLTFFKPNNNYIININSNVNINDIFGIDKLWDLLFELNSEYLSQKLINIIYSLYETKKEIQVLLDKCVNLIKDSENITYNKLQVCMNILKYIIKDSEKNVLIQIKSHNDLLKDCLIYINLEIKKNTSSMMDYLNKIRSSKNKNVLFGNTTLIQVKQILSEIYNIEEKDININLKNGDTTSSLTEIYLNKNLKEIFNLNREEKRGLSPFKLKFLGNIVEKEYLVRMGFTNPKFDNMIKEWFTNLTNGNEIMDRDAIDNFVAKIEPDKSIDEEDSLYNKLMKYDKGNKSFLLEEEFEDFYNKLAKNDANTCWEHIKKMGYGQNLERVIKSSDNNYTIVDKNKLPRYILGNDNIFHEALIKLFNKFDKNMNIFQFLFFLCTNEKKYNELFDSDDKLITAESEEDINYLEELYNLLIIESFIQDLEAKKVNLEKIFREKINQGMNQLFGTSTENKLKNLSKDYLPFDDEANLEKKRIYLVNLIEKGGYEKIIKKVVKTLETVDNNFTDEEKIKIEYCQHCIILINLLYDSFISKDAKKENKANDEDDVYFLYEKTDITQILATNNENDKESQKDSKDKINKLKEIVLNTEYLSLIDKLILFLLKFHQNSNEPLNKHCFKLFLKLVTTNQKLFEQIKVDKNIKQKLSDLIKYNINSKERFFIQSLKSYIRELSSNKQEKDKNKLDNEFLIYLFEISNSLFNELITNKKEEKNNENKSNSILSYFEYFSDLLKEILKNSKNKDIITKLNGEFISQIYTLLYNDIKEKNSEKKLPEDIFVGIMKILITIIKSDKEIKEQIIYTKINDETLFDVIYNKLIPENDQKENSDNNLNNLPDDDLDINNLLSQINEDSDMNPKFIKIDNLSEIIHIFNTTKKENKEEIISEKVSINFKNYIMACLNDCTNIEYILKLLKIIISFDSKTSNYHQMSNITKKPKSKKESKKCGYVGLKNIGCICYMNSILQQMYMVTPFRNAIISSDDKKEIKTNTSIYNNRFFDDNLLHQLQKMYTFLTFSEKQAYNPKDFCSAFKDLDGQSINIHMQQDSQEFYNTFCDKIESLLKKTKFKYVIDNIFTGKMCSSVICEQCHNLSNRFEDFYNLSLEVKNINNLYDSLKKFTAPEKIEEFNCETCNKKVTIKKLTSLAKLPNVLFIHLKRFYMNYEKEETEKINSKFEFPNTINLKNFCVEENSEIQNNSKESDSIYKKIDDYYEYELKGINVHLGSAEGGHYISFIDVERDGNNNESNIKSSIENDVIKSRWLKFNDSIVTEFDTKDIPIESYGGFVDDNINNENSQNAYILIYERKKKMPIKIVIEKENEEKYLNDEKYKIVSFPKEKRNYINKYYDISNSNPDSKIKEEDLYNIIFKDEENEEYYFYIPYYNIEKNVLKENFIEVMNKNKKFWNRSVNIPLDLSKYKDTWNEILFSIIKTKDFDILNEAYSYQHKKQFLIYFKDEILSNKRTSDRNTSDDEQKIILNDRADILIKKLIMPLVKVENKNKEIYDLLDYICTILTVKGTMEKYFECKNMMTTGIFSIENVKLICEVLYSIFTLIEYMPRNKRNFSDLFELIKNIKINKDSPFLMMHNSSFNNNDDDEEEEEQDKVKEMSGYYYIELINKVFRLSLEYVTSVKDKEPIFSLLQRIKKSTYKENRKIIYEISTYLLEQYYGAKLRKRNDNEKSRIQSKIFEKNLLKFILEENSELFILLADVLQYNDRYFSEKMNQLLIADIFDNIKIKKNKINVILNILFKIINIKDTYTMNRLYILMGFPNMIIKNKKQKILEESKKEEKEKKETKGEEEEKEKQEEDEKEADNEDIEKQEKEKYTLFPKFGYSLLEENKDEEIYKYRGNFKLFETHCILAQLFPCSESNLYSYNFEDKKNDNKEKNNKEKLSEKERIDYIYQLLSMSLLGEGNYALFKYIYLTPSRFFKYDNLYDEMLDILSQEKENKIYDLTEIKKNGEICLKRINYEINRMKKNISTMFGKKIDYETNDKNEKPDLPENMREINENAEETEEFTGFYPRILPDKISKIEYVMETEKDYICLIIINYYTSIIDIEKIKKKSNSKEKEQSPIQDKNEIILEKNKIDKEEDSDEDDDYERLNHKTFYRNKIEDDEEKIIEELVKFYKQKNLKKITVINEIENNLHKKIKDNLTLSRFILYSNKHEQLFWQGEFKEKEHYSFVKYNYYYPEYSNGYMEKMDDLLVIYRRNMILDFIKDKALVFNIQTTQKRKELNGSNDSF